MNTEKNIEMHIYNLEQEQCKRSIKTDSNWLYKHA